MLSKNKQRFNIDLDELRENNDGSNELANYIIANPQTVIKYMEK